jgi:endonuclease-3
VSAPLELILWDNVAYLADDGRRSAAFAALRDRVGTTPAQILGAPLETLVDIAGVGILPTQQAEKLRQIAAIALADFDGDVARVGQLSLSAARKALQRFPGIGEPGAEKVLLLARTHAVLALESNGLRVLVRLGYGRATADYRATYRAAQAAVQDQLQADCGWLIRLHFVLRQHGQELCRRSQPQCVVCPLADGCRYVAAGAGAAP